MFHPHPIKVFASIGVKAGIESLPRGQTLSFELVYPEQTRSERI
jgi:hypothetical protein